VPIARNRTGATTDAMLDKVDTANVAEHFGPVVEKTPGPSATARGFLHVWIIASKGEHIWQGHHIQNVNAYTRELRTWMVRFKGVATKDGVE
jgi:hypothetical protein